MKIKQNMELLFWLNRSKVKSGAKAPIYIRVTIGGSHREISLGEKVAPVHWDGKSKRVEKADPLFRSINSKIMQARVDLDQHFASLQSRAERITPDMVKRPI